MSKDFDSIQNEDAELKINLNKINFPKLVFWSLFLIQVILVLLDYIFNFSGCVEVKQIRRIFNIAREVSIPTWFSSLQLFIIGCMMWLISLRKSLGSFRKFNVICWGLAGSFFIFLSIDDAAKVHERLGHIFKHNFLEVHSSHGSFLATFILDLFPSFGWHLIIAPIYAIFGLLIIFFILHELSSKNLRFLFLLAICMFTLACGIDYVEGLDGVLDTIWNITELKKYTITHYSKVIEEFLEMTGATIIIYVCISYFVNITNELRIKFK